MNDVNVAAKVTKKLGGGGRERKKQDIVTPWPQPFSGTDKTIVGSRLCAKIQTNYYLFQHKRRAFMRYERI